MPFNVNEQPIPYYKPVAPEVPVADNTAARFLAAGGQAGVAMFTQRAIASEKAQIDYQQMLQQADLQANQLKFERERLSQSYELTKRGQDIQNTNVLLDFEQQDRHLDMESELLPHRIKNIDALTDMHEASATHMLKSNTQRAALIEEAGKDAEGLGLMDPKFQTEHPMIYAKNAYGFQQMYGATSDSFLKGAINKFIKNAEESKVTLTDPITGDKKEYSWAHVARDIATNGTKSPFIDALQESGFFDNKQADTGVKVTTKTGTGKQQSTERKPKATLAEILRDAKAANFPELKTITPKTETFTTGLINAPGTATFDRRTSKAGRLNAGAALPDPDPTAADTEAAYARKKIEEDPANADKYRALFFNRNPNADPAALD